MSTTQNTGPAAQAWNAEVERVMAKNPRLSKAQAVRIVATTHEDLRQALCLEQTQKYLSRKM